MEFEYRKYREEDKPKVLELLSGLWNMPYEKKLAYFNWKYEQNPYTDSPLAYVALDGDKIVAFRGYMAQPIIIKNNILYNAVICDMITDSSYRRKGLFYKLTNFSIEDILSNRHCLISINSSSGGPTSFGYIKLGWEPLIEREHIFSFNLFSKYKPISSTRLRQKDNEFIDIDNNARSHEMASLFKKNRNEKLFVLDKDEKYIKWRYSNPLKVYNFLYYYVGEKLVAYCVFDKRGYDKFDLVDYETENKYYLKKILKVIRTKISPKLITHWTSNHNDMIYKNKFEFGFIKIPYLYKTKKFRKPPVLIRPICEDITKEESWLIDGQDIRYSKNWALMKIMSDEI